MNSLKKMQELPSNSSVLACDKTLDSGSCSEELYESTLFSFCPDFVQLFFAGLELLILWIFFSICL